MINSYTSTITSKGQATIPAPIRKKLGIKSGETLIFEEKNQEVLIKTHTQLINELAGSLKTSIKWNKKQAYEAVEKTLAQRDIRSKK